MRSFLRAVAIVVYSALGILQIAAIVTGVTESLGFIGIVLAVVLGPLPLIGTIMGVVGATQVWGWSVGAALLLFVGPLAVSIVAGLLSRE